jgi:hypothetical protein
MGSEHDRRGGRRVAIAIVLATFALSACTGRSHPRPAAARTTGSGIDRPSLDLPTGEPLLGHDVVPQFAWKIELNTVLRDDSRTLWNVRLDGTRTALWTHPKVAVNQLAVSRDHASIALAVGSEPEQLFVVTGGKPPQLIDTATQDKWISSVTFLRPPTGADRSERLFWVRGEGGEYNATTGAVDTRVIERVGGRNLIVPVPLRHHEAVDRVSGYPGSDRFSVDLLRRTNDPTLYEVLENQDALWDRPATTAKAATEWSAFASRANTDSDQGEAWISESDFVVAVTRSSGQPNPVAELQRFRRGCGANGPDVLDKGSRLAVASIDLGWRLVAVNANTVLVVAAAELAARSHDRPLYWSKFDLTRRVIEPTRIEYGEVAGVPDPNPTDQSGKCDDLAQ